jgi:dihydroneopterin aldolase
MSNTIQIKLNKLRFFSFHGLYKEEKKIGGEFEVNVSVSFTAPQTTIDSIYQTPDYTAIFNLVKEEMNVPTELLETLTMKIGNRIKLEFDQVDAVQVAIQKLHPPIAKFNGNIEVVFEKRFS